MFLKRLELQGYKTFANRTEFEFNSGITAIVGPNGSGKSNIADAIRWALGEQRQSSLRIKRTEDLIFAGSRQRPRQGMAEVSLTFDNTRQWLPVEYSEVTITRRIYRSGESEYYVNGTRMRVRDVIEMLSKGGLASDAYVVIGQGLVDAALSLRPIERRSLFEVAAGIQVYQAKKMDALNKLEETRQNLVRVNDILNEIAPRLSALQAQAQRAEEYALLSKDLAESLRLWYGYHWQRQWRLLQEAEMKRAELIEFVSHQQLRVQEIAQHLLKLGQEQAQLRQSLSAWHRESSLLHTQTEQVARDLAVSQERYRLLLSQKEDLEKEISLLDPQRLEQEDEIQRLQQELKRLEEERQQAEVGLQQARVLWQQESQKLADLECELQSAQERWSQVTAALKDYQNRLVESDERRTEIQRECQELENIIRQREDDDVQLLEMMQKCRQQAQTILREMAGIEAEAARLRSEAEESRKQLESLEREQREIEQEIAAMHTRRRILQKMRQELSGYYAGVRTVLQASEAGELSGIHGPVVRLMRVSPELDAAIEVALGSHLQDIVVEHWQDADRAIALLKRVHGGRATFLPLDSLRYSEPPQILQAEGVLGLASQLIQFEPRYRPVFELLLNRTIVVVDLKAAKALLPRISSGLRLVTLEGELVLSTGSVSGGSREETDSKIALERDWQEIPERLEELSSLKADLERRKERQREKLQLLGAEIQEVESKVTSLRQALDAQREEEARCQRRRERLQEEIAWYQGSLRRFEKEKETLIVRQVDLQARREAAEREQAALSSILAGLEERKKALRSEELRQAVAAAEADVAIASRNWQNQQRLLDSQQASLRRLQEQIISKRQRSSELDAAIREVVEHIEELQGDLNKLQGRLEELRGLISPAEDKVVALDEEEKLKHEEEERERQRLRDLESRVQQAALEEKLLREELQRLQRRVEEELGAVALPQHYSQQLRLALGQEEISLPEITILPENLESEILELRARLRRMGVVNPNAPAEYQEVLSRYTFLTEQAADLEKASQALRNVISELDEIMEREFSQTFRAVSREFSRYFALLFGGGTAKLTLTDPDDLNNTGVEISVRPPGKRPQSLALLSGGERALTAAALLFAILATNPLPFCVLDEVDAMLDEANVGRFRDILQEMSQRTQFIVITHNRQTIEAANTIYGISMQQDGVSAVLSLRLDEVEREITTT